jgi:hypothetical protein
MSEITLFKDEAEARELKLRFAEALLREPDNAFKAGIDVFGADTGRALFAATKWITDDVVIAERSRLLLAKGARSFLPSKEEYAREVWRQATNERAPIEDRTRLLTLYGDVMGFKEAAQKNAGGIIVNNNKVMFVRDFGDDKTWEAKAAAQQHALTNQSVTDVIPVGA